MGNIGRLGSEGGVRRKLVASLGRRVLVGGSLAGWLWLVWRPRRIARITAHSDQVGDPWVGVEPPALPFFFYNHHLGEGGCERGGVW